MTPAPIDLKIVDERLEIVRVAVADLRSLAVPERAAFLSDRRNAWAADAPRRPSPTAGANLTTLGSAVDSAPVRVLFVWRPLANRPHLAI